MSRSFDSKLVPKNPIMAQGNESKRFCLAVNYLHIQEEHVHVMECVRVIRLLSEIPLLVFSGEVTSLPLKALETLLLHRIDSKIASGWKGPLKVILSSPMCTQQGHVQRHRVA